MIRLRLTSVVLLSLLMACSSSSGEQTEDVSAAMPDGMTDGAISPLDLPDRTDPGGELPSDFASPELTDSVADEFEAVDLEPEDLGPPPPVADPVEPLPVEAPLWLVTYAKDADSDKVGDMLDKGTFVMPEGPGYDANGVEWLEREPGDKKIGIWI